VRIDFGRASSDLFATEKKWMTILGLCVSMLIPVAGMMVAFGYLTRRFMREREGKPPEDFEFNYFAEYLKIGLWPTLAAMVVSLVLAPLGLLLVAAMMFAMPLMDEHPDIGIPVVILAILLYLLGCVAAMMVVYPVMIRSALTMSFGKGFSWPFIRSFIGKVGLSLIGYYALLMVISVPLTLLGYFALIVGVYLVAAWLQFVIYHLVFQHYDLFLARGGERIEVNPEVTRDLPGPLPAPPALPPAGG
jgi:hypothetical protein